jgi:non-ribosomal peptide synthetase component F
MFIRYTDRLARPPAGAIRSQTIRHYGDAETTGPLSSLPDAEWALLAACANADWDITSDASIPQLIAEQVCLAPDEIAVIVDGEEMSYAQLWARAGAVAGGLRVAGVRLGHLVGLCCERSTELVIGMLGILRSGAAYVPLDPAYSAERLTFMRKDIGLRVIVAQVGVSLPDGAYRTIVVDPEPARLGEPDTYGLLEDDPWAAGPDDLAYLSYPAGPGSAAPTVMASHRNVLSLLAGTRSFG